MDVNGNEGGRGVREHAIMLLEEGLAGDVEKVKKLRKLFKNRDKIHETPGRRATFLELKNRLKQESDKDNPVALDLLGSIADFRARRMKEGQQQVAKYEKARRLYERAAERGNASAQNALGILFMLGCVGLIDEKPDYEEAAKWFRLAATTAGGPIANTVAQVNLSRLYFKGYIGLINDHPNYEEAVKWCQLAAEGGNSTAQDNLGNLYWGGLIGAVNDQPNYEEAAKWYRLAAQNGSTRAQNSLGNLYFHGCIGAVNDQPNYEEAAKWFRLAAKEGNSIARHTLGSLYYQGRIGTIEGHPDYAEAARWFRLAAEEGKHASAQYNLGNLYRLGLTGILRGRPNYAEAAKWFRLAAEQDHREAEEKLISLGAYVETPGAQLRAIELQQFLYSICEERLTKLERGSMPVFMDKKHPKQWLKFILTAENMEEIFKQAVVQYFVNAGYPLNKLVWEKALLDSLGRLLLNIAKELEVCNESEEAIVSETRIKHQGLANLCLMNIHKKSDSWIEAQLMLLTKLQAASVEAAKAEGISDEREAVRQAYANIKEGVEVVKKVVNYKILGEGVSHNEQAAFEALENRIEVWKGDPSANSRKRANSVELNGAPKRVNNGKLKGLGD